tara:strand:- start:3548 stop:4111 length:564 start_codon:yes stop_codon:yes gene_type:complete
VVDDEIYGSVNVQTNKASRIMIIGINILRRKIWYPPSISYAGLLITSSTLSDMPLLDRYTPQLANQNRAAKKVRAVGPPYINALLVTGVSSTLLNSPVSWSRIKTVFSDLEYLSENSLWFLATNIRKYTPNANIPLPVPWRIAATSAVSISDAMINCANPVRKKIRESALAIDKTEAAGCHQSFAVT